MAARNVQYQVSKGQLTVTYASRNERMNEFKLGENYPTAKRNIHVARVQIRSNTA